MGLVFLAIYLICYMVLGFILMIPYCALAVCVQGSREIILYLAPLVLLIGIILAFLSGILKLEWFSEKMEQTQPHVRSSNSGLMSKWPFVVWVVYWCLPIIFHQVGSFLNFCGYNSVGTILVEHRFIVMRCVLVAVFVPAFG